MEKSSMNDKNMSNYQVKNIDPAMIGSDVRADRVARSHLDALLDEALQETFPASDPIAVIIELNMPGHETDSRAKRRAAQAQPHGVSNG